MLPGVRLNSRAAGSSVGLGGGRTPSTYRLQHACPRALARRGPSEPPPSYDLLDAQPLNRAVMALFRAKMVKAIGSDSSLQG